MTATIRHRPLVRETELGIERLCRWCDEWWPLDGEFWYFKADGGVMGRCKACWAENRRGAA